MNKFTLAALLTITANFAYGQNFSLLGKAGDGSSNNQAYSVVIDHAHNTIITGAIKDTSSFSGTLVDNRGIYNGFIAKYDSSGALLWTKDIGGSSQDVVGHSAVDASNNIYIAGRFKSSAVYFTATDSLVKTPGTSVISNSFLAKFDPSGTFLWAKLIASNTQVESWAVTVDPWGYPVIGGLFNMDVEISGTSLTNAFYNLYVAKYTPAGALDWAKMGTSEGLCKINELSSDSKGNIYAIGKFSSNLTFGTVTATNIGGDDAWFGKMDSTGKMLFMKVLGGSYFVTTTSGALDAGNTIQPDKHGNFYVGGSLLIDYGPPLSQQGFYAKYNDTGGQVWMHYFGTGSETVTGIALDADGNPYLSGLIYGVDTIGDSIVPYTAGGNTFVGRFNPATGNAVWIKHSTSATGSSGNDMMAYLPTGAIAIDQSSGFVMVAGQFNANISFDAYNATSLTSGSGYSDIYIARVQNKVANDLVPGLVADEDITLYPNPAKSTINCAFGNAIWHKVSLVNESGRLLNEWETNAPVFTADVQSFAPGNYFLVFADNFQHVETRKIVVLHN